MPNYCYNRINIKVTVEELESIKERVMSTDEFGDEYFDFNKIIPKPENMLSRSYGLFTLEAFSKYYYENPDNLSKEILDEIIQGKTNEIYVEEKLYRVDDYISKKYTKEELKSYTGEKLLLWYDWCIENWGTKWSSLYSEITTEEISFDTAWTPISEELFEEFVGICEEIIGNRANQIWMYYEENGNEIYGRYYMDYGYVVNDTDYTESEEAV